MGIAQLLVAALYILTARGMQPDEYGTVVTAIGVGLACAGFIDLGANAYWVRELASQQIAADELNARMASRFLIVLAASAATVVGALIIAPEFVATGFLLSSSTFAQTSLVPLRAAQRSEAVAWLTVVGRVFSVAVFLGQTSMGIPAGVSLWSSLVLGDVTLTLCALAVTPKDDRPRIRLRSMANPWSGTKWYAVTNLSVSAQQLDLPIVAVLAGSGAAGIYGGVNRWTQPLLVAIGAFASAAAPFMAAEPRLAALRGQLLRASWILVAAIGLSLGVFVAAPWLVTSLLGSSFSNSAPILRLLALAMLLNCFTQPMLVALQSRRRDHLAAGIVAAAVVVQLTFVVALTSSLGALAAGIGVLIAQVIALVGTMICIVVIYRRRSKAPN
ncbi:hypothetical protein Y900_017770 [Mycolicibacterium aromaticivorans JS19b1 = JCM 16368]|uniref:Polysaccharide biosynthesis protein C-terminal domain-containing protein n=2 Tax=Mycolicibacterium aromaticivorans TaxID=318425 RepID=A0A064CPJ8_9MYCO|nr:hypothetical protein Y900_017770 [Mycolicibacterium aromaticivorans JS19b1 = JCM 16368]